MLAWRIENASRQLFSHRERSTDAFVHLDDLPPASSTNCSCASWYSIYLASNWNPGRLDATVLEPRCHGGEIEGTQLMFDKAASARTQKTISSRGLDVPAQCAERGRGSPELPSSSRLPPVHGG